MVNETRNAAAESKEYFYQTTTYAYLYATLCTFTALVTVTANIVLFVTVLRNRNLRTPTNSFLLSLATADLVSGGIMMPLYTHRFIMSYHRESDTSLCLTRKFLFLLTSGLSLTSLAVVSADRMIAVSYPFYYARKITARATTVVIILVWLYCVLLTSLSTFIPFGDWKTILSNCLPGVPRTVYLAVTPPAYYLSGVIILFSHIKIFMVARNHRRKIQAQTQPTSLPSSASDDFNLPEADFPTEISPKTSQQSKPSRIQKISVFSMQSKRSRTTSRSRRVARIVSRDLKAARTITVLVGLFLGCWSPVAAFYIYINTKKVDIYLDPKWTYIHDAFMLLSFLNAALDPILYSLLNQELRRNIKKLLFCKSFRDR